MVLTISGVRLVRSVVIMDPLRESTGARAVNILFLQGAFNPRMNQHFLNLTCMDSVDQTSRVHGAIRIKDPTTKVWHELSRPQVHGYDLVDVAFIDPFKFVSISDEKVVRVFEAPRGFVQVVKRLSVSETPSDEVRFFTIQFTSI